MSKPGRYLGTDRAQVFGAGACWFERRAWAEGGGRESPGMRVTFFRVAERKSPKKGRPPVCDPFASLRGNLRLDGCGVRRRTHFALARFVQTTAASQLTRHARFDAHAHPATAPPQAQPDGGWTAQTSEQPHGPLLRSALSRGRKRRALGIGPSEAMARRDVRLRVPFTMRRGAQRPADQGSRLSERSEFERDPAGREHRRLPRSEAQGRRQWGRPFFGDFLSAKRKKVTRTPGDSLPPPCAEARRTLSVQAPATQHKHAECFQIYSYQRFLNKR